MSFIDDIVDVGSSVWDWATGNSTSAGLARAAALAYALNEITASIKKDNEKPVDKTKKQNRTASSSLSSRDQLDPDSNNYIPVVYGKAFVGGICTDAYMMDDKLNMWFCLTLCEQTGTLMSSGQPSSISFHRIWWNNSLITFKSDGVSVDSMEDENGNEKGYGGLIKIYAFSGGSNKPVKFNGGGAGGTDARDLFPEWKSTHEMKDLVFLLVKVTYDKEIGITGLGNIQVELKNTMKMAGDCIYDYMTNTRYGAGIKPEEIYQ